MAFQTQVTTRHVDVTGRDLGLESHKAGPLL